MSPEFDFTDAEPWEPGSAILTARREPYLCTIERAETGSSSNSNPQIELELAASTGEGSIRDWIVITAATLGKVTNLTDSLGWDRPGRFDTDSDDWSRYVAGMVGRSVGVFVRQEVDYQDPSRKRDRVAGYCTAAQAQTDVPPDLESALAGSDSSRQDEEIPF